MRVPLDLYLQVLNGEYIKIILIIVFGRLSTCCFSYEINMFVGLHKKHNALKIYKIKNVQHVLRLQAKQMVQKYRFITAQVPNSLLKIVSIKKEDTQQTFAQSAIPTTKSPKCSLDIRIPYRICKFKVKPEYTKTLYPIYSLVNTVQEMQNIHLPLTYFHLTKLLKLIKWKIQHSTNNFCTVKLTSKILLVF